ncbi:anti-sigma factor [Flavitalea flava]
MNEQDYISDGSNELYVFGMADESEKAIQEQLSNQDPKILADRLELEQKLEKFARENGENPPAMVKDRIFEMIDGLGNQLSRQTLPSNPSKTITMQNENVPRRSSGLLQFLAAASVILLVIVGYFNYRSNKQNEELKNANVALSEKLNTTDSILKQIVAEQKIVKDPNVTVVNMVGTQVAPKSSANIYWDSTSSNVFLVVKNMPKLPSDQQYQLWALIDGKPKDLGVFDANMDKVILQMKNTQKAQAFAITIEQKGGSPSPTLQKMQSLGKTTQTQ